MTIERKIIQPDPLVLLGDEFQKKELKTPKDYTQYWITRWNILSLKAGLTIKVTPCDRTAEDLKMLEREQRTLLFNPNIGLENLGVIHPDLKSWIFSSEWAKEIISHNKKEGWLDIEDSIQSPNPGRREEEVIKEILKSDQSGMSLDTYIIGSCDFFDRTGLYFDYDDTISRLPGSFGPNSTRGQGNNYMFHATFNNIGVLIVNNYLFPYEHMPYLGYRTQREKK